MSKCQEIARQFLSKWFQPEDTFALLARYPEASRTLQRIVRLPDLMNSNYLGWLALENSRGANIYFSINPLALGATKRTKSAVATAKGLYLDLDSDGDYKLAALRESTVGQHPVLSSTHRWVNIKSFGASRDSRFRSKKRC